VGCATISQALRLAATRTREEIGGVYPAEWRNARAATWKTTLLGLNNEIGQVVSISHLDVPGNERHLFSHERTVRQPDGRSARQVHSQ
jgi:hypothetical protein